MKIKTVENEIDLKRLFNFFSKTFYNLDTISGIWVAIFSFIGAPTIYDLLKKQNIINYTPKSLDNNVIISKENEIKRL